MKNLILTFDYELFLNESGTIENCILKPVNLLRPILKKGNIQAVFFIDVLFLIRLKEEGLIDQYAQVKKNIQELIIEGHDIELHLHPHWIDATYDSQKGTWDLKDNKNYRVHKLPKDLRVKLFGDTYNLLDEIGKEVKNDFKITSFRAGGLCLQPFEDFEPLFKQFDITIDSSVAPEMVTESETHYYNYKNAPRIGVYKFSTDPLIEKSNGEFIEFPIPHFKKNILDKFIGKIKKENQSNVIFGDGKPSSPFPKTYNNSFFTKLKSDKYLFSLDGDFSSWLLSKKIASISQNPITILCHPKLLSKESLEFIKKASINKNYQFDTFNSYLKNNSI